MAISTIDNNGVNLGQLGNRSMVTNGSMQVAQRGTTSTLDEYQTVDRFRTSNGGLDEAVTQEHHTLTSSDTGVWELGFRHSYKQTNGNQTSGAGTSDRVTIQHRIEGQDIATSGWDYTSSSSDVTLSFWCKSSVAQNFYARLQSYGGTQQNYAMETGSLTANTWTKITKTISGASAVAFDNDNTLGALLEISLFRGTNSTGTRALNVWEPYDTNVRVPDMDSTWYTTNDATFEITGVQLEVGDTATPFEHRSYGDELAKCQRYFYLKGSGTGFGSAQSGSGAYARMYALPERHPVEMRATPTVSLISGGSTYFAGGGGVTVGTPTGDIGTIQNSVHTLYSVNSSTTGVNRLSIGDGFSFTRGMSYVVTSNFIQVDAEL